MIKLFPVEDSLLDVAYFQVGTLQIFMTILGSFMINII